MKHCLKLLQREFCAWIGFAEVRKQSVTWIFAYLLQKPLDTARFSSTVTFCSMQDLATGGSSPAPPFSLKCQKRPREGMLQIMCQQPKQVRHWKNVGAHVDHKCAIGNVRFGLIGIYMFQWQRNIRRKWKSTHDIMTSSFLTQF